jgi:hypothetical protein
MALSVFLKEPKGSGRGIRNEGDLSKIKSNKLFISESKYAYDIDEIVSYFEHGKVISKTKMYKASGHMTGILQDYKNANISLFTQRDIENLLKDFPNFQEVVEKDPEFNLKQDYAAAIRPETLNCLKKIALQFAGGHTDPAKIRESINDLYTLLTKDIKEFPNNEQDLRIKERQSLNHLTEYDFVNRTGLTTYGCDRRKNLISDLTTIIRDGKEGDCPKEFFREVANLYLLVMTHRNYQEAKEYLLQSSFRPG